MKQYSLDKLSQYVGNDINQIKEMISLFLDKLPPDIDLLKKYTYSNDWQKVYEIAHRIKPSIEIFDMDSILFDIKDIEKQARENNIEGNLDTLISELSKKFSKVILLLQKELE